MDFDLTDEQALIKQTAREFTDKEVVPRAGENSRNHHFDLELVRKIADQGYLGAIVPARVRRRRARLRDLRDRLRGDRARLLGDAHGHLGADLARVLDDPALGHRGAEAALPAASCARASGWGASALTEPDTGSDAANQSTRATREDDGAWRINGAKMWISMGNHAQLALVFAQTDPELRHKGLACFLVETDQPGFMPAEIHGKMGLWASDTASIALDDVVAGPDAMLGEIGDGFKVAMTALDSGRYSVAAGCVGICQGSVEESVATRSERQQFERPIASFQLVQEMIADMVVRTDAARMLVSARAR